MEIIGTTGAGSAGVDGVLSCCMEGCGPLCGGPGPVNVNNNQSYPNYWQTVEYSL